MSVPAQRRPDAGFATTVPERGEAFLTSAYGTTVRFSAAAEGYRLRHVRRGPGTFHVDGFEHAATADVRCGPFHELACLRMERGTRTDLDSGDTFGPGDLAVNARPGEPFHLRYSGAAYTAVLIPVETVAAVARTAADEPLPELRFTSRRPIDAVHARAWRQAVDHAVHHLRAFPDAVAEPLLSGPMSRLLAATMLATFPNTWLAPARSIDRTDATDDTLRRAVDFIEGNADLDLSAADIARSAHVTVRAVQLAFRGRLDTTPMAYLRSVRLDRAQEELLAGSRDTGLTVTRVAARWGFADPGRFAGRYRRAFGESPGETLDR